MLKKILFLLLLMTSFYMNSQEFTIKKTKEEIQLEKDKKKEEKYLKFQEHFFNAIQQKAKEDYNKAIEELETCKQIYPNDAGLNFEFAKNYLLLKDYENAVFFSELVLNEKPKNINVLEHLKKTHKAQRNYNEAIKVQNKIIAINPKKESDLIHLYIINRDKSKAQELFLSLEKRHQIINHESYYRRILFPKKVNAVIKKEKSTHVNQEVIATDTDATGVAKLQSVFYKNKDYKSLVKLVKEEQKLNNNNLLVKDTKFGLELYPAQPFLYLAQGKAQNNLAKYQQAVAVLNAGLDFIIDNKKLESMFYLQINKAYIGLGNHNEAKKYLEKANRLK